MGINVALLTEFGEELDYVGDPQGVLAPLLPAEMDEAYPFLNSIDLYGNTVFNRIQMDRFLKEWEYIESGSESESAKVFTSAVKRMAERCRVEVHTYLKFIGD